ncbi:Exostosin-3 [Halotydeus destructor]|nr:Exostosin-3 [Halotydeus destructor]
MLRQIPSRLLKIVSLIIFLLLVLPLFAHYYLSKYYSEETTENTLYPHPRSEQHTDQSDASSELEAALKIKDLTSRIKEMVRIRSSVSNELRSLEGKRHKLQSEISSLSARVDEVKGAYSKKQSELEQIRISLDQLQHDQKEANLKNQPFIARPIVLLPVSVPTGQLSVEHSNEPIRLAWTRCSMKNCFDYSRCSLTSGFPVYVYPLNGHEDRDDDGNKSNVGQEETDTHLVEASHQSSRQYILTEAFRLNKHVTSDASIACIYVVAIFPEKQYFNSSQLDKYLRSLPFWGSEGHNHVIINFEPDLDILDGGVNPGRALVVQSKFTAPSFREKFDMVFNAMSAVRYNLSSNFPRAHCPSHRKYLASYRGNISEKSHHLRTIVSVLREIEAKSSADSFLFEFDAVETKSSSYNNNQLLEESMFSLILPPAEENVISCAFISEAISASLLAGSVPVVLGGDYLKLPFDDVIDWHRVAILLPVARVSELHFILKTLGDGDLLQMKRQGNTVYDRYLANTQRNMDTLLAAMRQKRLQIPALPAKDEPSIMLYNASNPMKYFDPSENEVNPDSAEPEENLGPLEPSFPSISYLRKYSLSLVKGYEMWNEVFMDPFTTYPHTPFDPIVPSEAKFVGSSYGFRPIGGGAGGSGKEFSERLGGNLPKEQFTIVMLTYEREAVLIDSLAKLKGLPYLNKVLVVWNSPKKMPSPDLSWPDVGVPIEVIRTKENSLNNRFKPFDEIETEAILSMDDDAHLRHDEIIFGFRVWREARDRIVGFPGRYHAWDIDNGGWHYNSNYSCELSMVLTGAAFFHKYYTYLYSYSMPSAIRDKVDEYVNCEDIAMNFLVSHVTRKPPIKVTSRWTFRCIGCPMSLSEDDSHFQERHRCINYFTQVYGYNPLLNTQFRADSVLFKTRIPHDKQKCFKFL